MRVLLLYSNQSRELVPAPPIGLSYVASAAAAAGHEVQLLDLAFAGDLLSELSAGIRRFAPDVVGLSIRNIDNAVQQRLDSPVRALQRQIDVIRKEARSPDGNPVPLVIGGPAISILAERALTVFGADFAVVGEGEACFPALLQAIERREVPERIPGVCYLRDGVAVRNPPALSPRFADSGLQRWIDWRRYEHEGGTWPIQTKRGCPMRCVYCTYPLVEGRRCREREPGEVVDEIERVQREVRPRTFEFVDSTFNLPASHGIAVCEELLRRGVKARFTAMGVNPLDVPNELFPLMKRAGFNSMMITPEAGCDAMLDNLGKGFTMRHVNACLDRAKVSGLASMWFFMLGGPGETMETCEESIRFAETRLTGWQFSSVFFTGIRILPGTDLARLAVERGHLAADTDLSDGAFYFSPDIDHDAVLARTHRASTRNPSIVQAAEGGASVTQHAFYRALRVLGVAPPYWRFLPAMLSFPVLRYLRSRRPTVAAARNSPSG